MARKCQNKQRNQIDGMEEIEDRDDIEELDGMERIARNNLQSKSLEKQKNLLTRKLSKTACYCLNEDSNHPFGNLFLGEKDIIDGPLPYLQSDVDEQLLLHLAFNQTVSLQRVEIGILGNGSCPSTIKMFVNKTNMGFSEATG